MRKSGDGFRMSSQESAPAFVALGHSIGAERLHWATRAAPPKRPRGDVALSDGFVNWQGGDSKSRASYFAPADLAPASVFPSFAKVNRGRRAEMNLLRYGVGNPNCQVQFVVHEDATREAVARLHR
jgi:hypothetical protein